MLQKHVYACNSDPAFTTNHVVSLLQKHGTSTTQSLIKA